MPPNFLMGVTLLSMRSVRNINHLLYGCVVFTTGTKKVSELFRNSYVHIKVWR